MKKTISLLLIFYFITNTYGQKKVSRLSIMAKSGLNYYFIEPKGSDIINNAGWTLPELAFEYNFNSVWSLQADFAYLTYNRQNGIGNTSDFALLASCNYFNLFFPLREGFAKNLSGYLSLGGGIGNYNYSINPTLTTGKPTGNDMSPFGLANLGFEYNLSHSFSLIAEGQIRAYNHDIGGLKADYFHGNSALVALVGIRYKIDAVRRTHWRNITTIDDCNCDF